MTADLDFFTTLMPDSRRANFHLGSLDSAVFIDFILSDENLIYLSRISFNGYGCCNLINATNYLNRELSNQFIEEMSNKQLNQVKLARIVKELLTINKKHIWIDVINNYNLIDND